MHTREAGQKARTKKKGRVGEADMSLVIVYSCMVIDHFMMSTVVSVLCVPVLVLYVRRDKTISRQDKVNRQSQVRHVNLSSPWAQAHHPTFVPPALSAPHAPQTQNSAAPQKRARSCSQDRSRPSLAPVSEVDRSESVTPQNTLLPYTSPVAVGDRGHSYAEPVCIIR